MIDGGHLRACFKKAKLDYTAENIEEFSINCFCRDETVYRIFYYDAPHYEGEHKNPISNEVTKFQNKDSLLTQLSKIDNFAIRKGRLKFAGWRLRPNILKKMTQGEFEPPVQDKHFKPEFSQKGVDMVLGLDVAAIAETNRVDQFMLVSADTDMAPALKYGRVHGMKAILIKPECAGSFALHQVLHQHSDIVRKISLNPAAIE